MVLTLEQEVNEIADIAAKRLKHDNNAVCIMHHINQKTVVQIQELLSALEDCRGQRTVSKTQLIRELENLAALGTIMMYFNDTYRITNIGKKVLERFPTDPNRIARKN
jgi:hypothetical protein